MFGKVNLQDELVRTRNRNFREADILLAVKDILEKSEAQRNDIRTRLSKGGENENAFNFDLLEAGRIFHIHSIREMCIEYRLRFLDSKMFKQNLPNEAISNIYQLEKLHGIKISGFKIAAPSEAFALENYDDPLLFAPLGNGYYYLIHKWGNDMSRWRKWLVLPFKNIMNFVMFCILISLVLTLLAPDNVLSRQVPMASTIIFLFIFKSVIAVLMYGFFMGGRKFNDMMWNSKFYNN